MINVLIKVISSFRGCKDWGGEEGGRDLYLHFRLFGMLGCALSSLIATSVWAPLKNTYFDCCLYLLLWLKKLIMERQFKI